jgi:DNA repair exonuclease SbcCD ATPase subunit
MTARAQAWPAGPVAVVLEVSELRRLVDEQRIRIAELEAERDSLRATILGESVVADQGENPERKGAAWWHRSWREVTRHRDELLARVQKLETWLLESGREAEDLQRELERSREQNGGLARLLAETEGDVVEANAARDEAVATRAEALERLARCECGAVPEGEEVH